MCFVGESERTPCSNLFSLPCFLEYQLETRLSFPVFSASFPGDGAPALPACMGVGEKGISPWVAFFGALLLNTRS